MRRALSVTRRHGAANVGRGDEAPSRVQHTQTRSPSSFASGARMCFFLFHKMTNSKCSPDPNRVESESVSNKCEVVYIKEKNLDDYISKMEPNWRGNIYYQ